MAERSSNPIATIWNRISHPVDTIRSRASDIGAHPFQNAASAGGGLLATLFGGPIAGQAVSGGLRNLFGRHNDNRFNEGAAQLLSDTNNNVSNQIWGQWQPGAGQSRGSSGPSGGMSGITSPYQPQSPQGQSALAQLLGLPDYANGNNGNLPPSQGQQDQASPVGAAQPMPSVSATSQSPQPINGAATSLGGMGRTVGTASMGQVEDMLGAGIGRSDIASRLTQGREVSQQRDQARANGPRPAGMTVMQWLQQNS